MWSDPLLRTSNMMGALFHDVAILCEGESDVRFLKSLLDDVYSKENLPDVEFYSCNGKSKIKSIAESLRSIKMPVVCCLDFDVLQNPEELFRLYRAMGGSNALVREQAIALSSSIESARFVPKAKTVIDKLIEELDKIERENPLRTSAISNLKGIIDHGSPWSSAKNGGIRSLQESKDYNSAKFIVEECEKVGILINIEGELESFYRGAISTRKSDWLVEVLQKDLSCDTELKSAREFSERLYRAIAKIKA